MLLKGVLIGAVISIGLVFLFGQLLNRQVQAIPGVGPGPISFDVYSLRNYATSFYGGLGIGFMVVMVPLIAGVYSFWRITQHAAGR
jgi:hypothetical protein